MNLGVAALKQLALTLDPYPRAAGAELPEFEADPEEHPLATLHRRH